jgi:uncharacterized membrane protein YjfL (UPF0719 family)
LRRWQQKVIHRYSQNFGCNSGGIVGNSLSVTTMPVRGSEVRLLRFSTGFLLWILVCACSSLALIASALWFWGAQEVRGDAGQVVFLTAVGAVWLLAAHALFPWLGLSFRDDALERMNSAALVALTGALLATAITFAAGNLGEGPSYSENIFCAAWSTGGLFALWLALELTSRVSVSIAEERDFATGLRFGALLLAWGLILGRAVTGNWHSCETAVHDFFHQGWVAALVGLVALVVERWLRPSRMRPFPSWPACGLLPALLYLAAAAAWLWHLGRWEGMPQ